MNNKELKAVLRTLGACYRGIAAVGRKGFKAAWAAAEQEDKKWLVRQLPTLAPLRDKYDADVAPLWAAIFTLEVVEAALKDVQ